MALNFNFCFHKYKTSCFCLNGPMSTKCQHCNEDAPSQVKRDLQGHYVLATLGMREIPSSPNDPSGAKYRQLVIWDSVSDDLKDNQTKKVLIYFSCDVA